MINIQYMVYLYQHPPRGGVWTLRACEIGTPTTIHLAPRKEGPGTYTFTTQKINLKGRGGGSFALRSLCYSSAGVVQTKRCLLAFFLGDGYLDGGNSNLFFKFTPKFGGNMIQFDYIIFFKWVGSTTS